MNAEKKLEKLQLAKDLIREVEFSYPIESPERKALYRVVVNTFSFPSYIESLMGELENEIKISRGMGS